MKKIKKINLLKIEAEARTLPENIGSYCLASGTQEIVESVEENQDTRASAEKWVKAHKNTAARGNGVYLLTAYAAEYYTADADGEFMDGSDYDLSDDLRPTLVSQGVIDEWALRGGVIWVDQYPEPQLYMETDAEDIAELYSERGAEYAGMSQVQYFLHLAKEALEWAGVGPEQIEGYLLQSLGELSLKGVLKCTGMTQQALADRFGIPKRTVENWSSGASTCPSYTLRMIKEILLVGACR